MCNLAALALLIAVVLAGITNTHQQPQPEDERLNQQLETYCRGIEALRRKTKEGGPDALNLEDRDLRVTTGYLWTELSSQYENPLEEEKKCTNNPPVNLIPLCRYFVYVNFINSLGSKNNFQPADHKIFTDYFDIVLLHPYFRNCWRVIPRNPQEPKAKGGLAKAIAEGDKDRLDALDSLYRSLLAKEIQKFCSLGIGHDDGIFCPALSELMKLLQLSQTVAGINNEDRAKKKALKLHYMILKYNYPEEFQDLEPNQADEVVQNSIQMLKVLFKLVNRKRVEKLRGLMAFAPGLETFKIGFDTSWNLPPRAKKSLRVLWKVIIGIHVYLKIGPSSARARAKKILNTDTDYKAQLQLTQLNSILQVVQNQERSIENLAEWINAELAKNVGDRFQGLQTYFRKTETFNRQKAIADVGYANGRLDKYITQIYTIRNQLTNDVREIVTVAFIAQGAELVEDLIQVAIQAASLGNFFQQVLESGTIEDLLDRIAKAVSTIGNLLQLEQIRQSLTTLVTEGLKINQKFLKNAVFLENVRVLINYVLDNSVLSHAEFEIKKQSFLSKYSDYDPQVEEPELSAMTTHWENLIDDVCDVLFDTSTSAGGAATATAKFTGICSSAKILAQKLISTYQEVYDFQFELIEAMASAMKAMTALDASSYLVTDFEKYSKATEESNAMVEDVNILSMASFIAYNLNMWQTIEDYCNILRYKQGGAHPSVCNGPQTDIPSLATYSPPLCRNTEAYKSVPTSGSSRLAFMNITELYSGRKVEFKIPNKEWLVENQWINQQDIDSAIFVKKFEIFLPTVSSNERMGRVEAKVVGLNQLNPTPAAPSYVIAPEKVFIFEFLEGDHVECRQTSQAITNPYDASRPKICPHNVDENNCLELLRKTTLFPSIYSKWQVSITGYESVTVPDEALNEDFKLKVGMKLCILGSAKRDEVKSDGDSAVKVKKDEPTSKKKKKMKALTIRGRKAGVKLN